jgi:hypothetical protein
MNQSEKRKVKDTNLNLAGAGEELSRFPRRHFATVSESQCCNGRQDHCHCLQGGSTDHRDDSTLASRSNWDGHRRIVSATQNVHVGRNYYAEHHTS